MKRGTPLCSSPDIEDGSRIVASISIDGTSLEVPILRCFVCNALVRKGRTIASKSKLAICNSCDGQTEKITEKTEKIRRTSKIEEIPLEKALCCYCNKPIINEKKIKKRLERKTTSGSLSERDIRRIEQKLKTDGWRNIGAGKYAHNRCSK